MREANSPKTLKRKSRDGPMKKFILLLTLLLLPMQALAADHELPQIDTGQYELTLIIYIP